MALTLFVGSNDSNLAKEAQSADPSAYLIDQNNQHQDHSGVCYTSISDLETLKDFASLLRQADTIIYVPDPSWTNTQKVKEYSERYWVEYYLYIFSLDRSKKIINSPVLHLPIDNDLMLTLNDQRKNNNKHLWVSGCSTTFGIGVETHERYANILAEKLNLPLCMLAEPGASVTYAADQILRSDIREGDLVILGITTHQRKTYYNADYTQTLIKLKYFDQWQKRRTEGENPKIIHVTPANFKEQNRKIDLTDPTLLYDSIIAVHQVLNFCQSVNAKLILLGMHADIEFATYLKDIPSYVHANGFYGVNMYDRFIDIGNDNSHAGPLMHQLYAEKILDKLQEIE